MKTLNDLKIKIFADGAELKTMRDMYEKPWIKGFTTNPTLMRKAGISDYRAFAKEILSVIKDKPISFEVFSDEMVGMKRQALDIASWGPNVFVKIPITNTKRESSIPLIHDLNRQNVQLNITAVMTLDQVKETSKALSDKTNAIISVFAGRIADTGRDPIPLMKKALEIVKISPAIELLWASPREILNLVQADEMGCHIITVTNDILSKLNLLGKSLEEFSLDTVKMFFDDAAKAGFNLD